MTGDCHARFCERLGVKFPGPTRRPMGEIGKGAGMDLAILAEAFAEEDGGRGGAIGDGGDVHAHIIY